jgi:hypothetical protein
MTLPRPRDDLANRVPVWRAMSEFYLDTELDDGDISRIARTCAASPFSIGELDRIMFCEVGPAFALNLLSMAGEWAGWSQQFVQERVLKVYRPWYYLLYVLNPFKRWMRLRWADALKRTAQMRDAQVKDAL